MKGIILDKTFSQELIKPKSSLVTDNLYNEILVSLLLHEKAYLPSEFLNSDGKYLEELIAEDLVSIIPKKYYLQEEDSVLKNVSSYQTNMLNYEVLSEDKVDYSINSNGDLQLKENLWDKKRLIDEAMSNATYISRFQNSSLKLKKKLFGRLIGKIGLKTAESTILANWLILELISVIIYHLVKEALLIELFHFHKIMIKNLDMKWMKT